jgi:hypothetical protein
MSAIYNRFSLRPGDEGYTKRLVGLIAAMKPTMNLLYYNYPNLSLDFLAHLSDT